MTTMADRCEILSVRAADGGARLILTVESVTDDNKTRETLVLLTSRLSHMPQKGRIDADKLAFLRNEHALCGALDTGLRSLAASGGSSLQLRQKLCAKGVARDVAAQAAAQLCEKGYLQEEKNALAAAERDLRKLWGDRLILADLRAKGYGEQALSAVRAFLEGEDGVARCARLIQKRHLLPCDADNADKMLAALMRYGYTRTEIRAALKTVAE
jgi:SOS response regulatory protein OraA/RecX